jgi:hypothetical protein
MTAARGLISARRANRRTSDDNDNERRWRACSRRDQEGPVCRSFCRPMFYLDTGQIWRSNCSTFVFRSFVRSDARWSRVDRLPEAGFDNLLSFCPTHPIPPDRPMHVADAIAFYIFFYRYLIFRSTRLSKHRRRSLPPPAVIFFSRVSTTNKANI